MVNPKNPESLQDKRFPFISLPENAKPKIDQQDALNQAEI